MSATTAKLLTALVSLAMLSCIKENTPAGIIETNAPLLRANYFAVNNVIPGFYDAVPATYESSNKKYPAILFIHGAGQYGNGGDELTKVLREAIPALLENKSFPPNFNVNGKAFSFIVLVPQFRKQPTNEDLKGFLDYVRTSYRIDESRIYVVGMSEGAEVALLFSSEYSHKVAAVVAMAGVPRYGALGQVCERLSDGLLPIWIFHNEKDEVFSINYAMKFFNLLESFEPAIAPRFTILKTFGLYGHDAWTRATDPRFREAGKNIYEWMLLYCR